MNDNKDFRYVVQADGTGDDEVSLPVADRKEALATAIDCQSALDWDPLSASKRDPFERRVRLVALVPSELAGVAETVRARVV